METKVLNIKGEEVGKCELPEQIFGVTPKAGVLHEATTIYLSNQRGGNAHTKNRGEVSGGGAKPWKQKGTGRARQGSNRSPIWRKGGVAFGPRNTVNWYRDLPRRKGKNALAQALSVRAADQSLRVVEALKFDGAKTAQVAKFLTAIKADNKSLIVAEQHDENLKRASRNIPGLQIRLASHLNAYEVLACRNLIITKGAIEKLAPKWS
ncbi:MAG: 50S ribosomal protein L4 [Elusimicrobia bacterium CG1_02_63_36]|nr:MAG: 50S ribosomal protein L4 [Elusimicrobia bacterium CG1_02_63_36]PIP85053.1 MAG: 50S ribosomal protein L4 [Elusimicrobia bacterium CG22_combo_CG10-13_8_21_14_all_63_91]PJA12528.1 MAG: 50S ribosomal protein L4 [Elusimicrobia bacterium CG_4_10_14_0_2_um_filter_63_34]PJB25284.1 MAG: 50S ribosomal protein L4 [Elusimicrobia bacterium CG_4_9_14_3_um_filter_62_55]